jgi:hypothetical protein
MLGPIRILGWEVIVNVGYYFPGLELDMISNHITQYYTIHVLYRIFIILYAVLIPHVFLYFYCT